MKPIFTIFKQKPYSLLLFVCTVFTCVLSWAGFYNKLYISPKQVTTTIQNINTQISQILQNIDQKIDNKYYTNGIKNQNYLTYFKQEITDADKYVITIYKNSVPVFWNQSKTSPLDIGYMPGNKICLIQSLNENIFCYRKIIDTAQNILIDIAIDIEKYIPDNTPIKIKKEAPNIVLKNIPKSNQIIIKNQLMGYGIYSDLTADQMQPIKSTLFAFFTLLPFYFCWYFFCKSLEKPSNKLRLYLLLVLGVFIFRLVNYFFEFPTIHHAPNLFNPIFLSINNLHYSIGDIMHNLGVFLWLIFIFDKEYILPKIDLNIPSPQIKILVCILFSILVYFTCYNVFTLINYVLRSVVHSYEFSYIGNMSVITINAYIIIIFGVCLLILISKILIKIIDKIYLTSSFGKMLILIISLLLFLTIHKLKNTQIEYLDIVLSLWLIFTLLLFCTPKIEPRRQPFSIQFLLWITYIAFSSASFVKIAEFDSTQKNKFIFATQILSGRNYDIENQLHQIQRNIQSDTMLVELIDKSNYTANQYLQNQYAGIINKYYHISFTTDSLQYQPLFQQFKLDSAGFDIAFLNFYKNQIRYLCPITLINNKKIYLTCGIELRTIENAHAENLKLIFLKPKGNHYFNNDKFKFAIYKNNANILQNSLENFPENLTKNTTSDKITYLPNTYNCWSFGQFSILFLQEKVPWLNLMKVFGFIFGMIFIVAVLYQLTLYFTLSRYNIRLFTKYITLNFRLRFCLSLYIFQVIIFVVIIFIVNSLVNNISMSQFQKKNFADYNFMYQKLINIPDQIHQNQNYPNLDSNYQIEMANYAKQLGIQINIYNAQGDLKYTDIPLQYLKNEGGYQIPPQYYFEKIKNKKKLMPIFQHFNQHNIPQLYFQFAPIDNPSNFYYASLLYANDHISIDKLKENNMSILINLMMVTFVFSGMLAYLFSKYLSNKLLLLSNKLKVFNVEDSQHKTVIHWDYNDEIKPLVIEYNKMAKKAQSKAKEMAETERDAAWREMAKQVAHDIKNPITPIKLTLQNLQRNLEKNHPNILEQTKRAADLILTETENLVIIASNFSRYAEMPALQYKNIDINKTVHTAYQKFQQAKPEAKYQFFPLPHPLHTIADGEQIAQIMNVFLINAYEAIQQTQNPTITVSISQHSKHIRLTVGDNGVGIPIQKYENIFKPHFSTKSALKGLSLAIAKEIAQKMNCIISFDSSQNQGTKFYLSIPIINE